MSPDPTARELYHDIAHYDGKALFGDVLQPWLRAARFELRWLADFRDREESPFPAARREDLWQLFAWSMVSQSLATSFQEVAEPERWGEMPTVSMDEFVAFHEAAGIKVHEEKEFHPFYHEIVEVRSPGSPMQIDWPCLMLGGMIYMRAGVRIAERDGIVAGVADKSPMMWATSRKHRPTNDPSDGWGHNSMWRTDFRRDYRVGDQLYYNVDGEEHIEEVEDDCGLSLNERIELVRHRCSTMLMPLDPDPWPYSWRMQEQVCS